MGNIESKSSPMVSRAHLLPPPAPAVVESTCVAAGLAYHWGWGRLATGAPGAKRCCLPSARLLGDGVRTGAIRLGQGKVGRRQDGPRRGGDGGRLGCCILCSRPSRFPLAPPVRSLPNWHLLVPLVVLNLSVWEPLL